MDEHRHTEPIDVYAVVDQLLPPRTWKENPLLWIGVVVAVFMAVPFLASWATRVPLAPAGRRRAADERPCRARRRPPASWRARSPTRGRRSRSRRRANASSRADSSRQMVTKCVERGRVVYTQTGRCAGSLSACRSTPARTWSAPMRRRPGYRPYLAVNVG